MNRYKIILLFYTLIQSELIQAQEGRKNDSFISAEIYAFCPNYYHFISPKNIFSYGLGLSIVNNYKPFKISVGANFYTQKIRINYPSTDSLEKTVNTINYFSIPILLRINLRKNIVDNNFYLIIGSTPIRPYRYNSISNYRNVQSTTINIMPKSYISGISFTTGIEYNKNIGRTNLFFSLYTNYKMSLDRLEFPALNPHPGNLVELGEKLQLGALLGVEYAFKTK
jgi:hypothetical protein